MQLAEHYDEVSRRLRVLHGRVADRLGRKDATLVAEFIEANELGLALEQIADVLSEDEHPLPASERAEMLDLVRVMQMGQRVPRALALCPDVGS